MPSLAVSQAKALRNRDLKQKLFRKLKFQNSSDIDIVMIEYIVATNIDDRVLFRAVRFLEEGGLVALPSDTSWLAVCSSASKDGLKKLRRISGERDERRFTLLCSDISQFGEFCSMDNTRFRLIKRLSPGPYVFILKTLPGTEKNLNLRRGEIGVRIPDHPVPFALIKTLGLPLYSVTAKRSMCGPAGAAVCGRLPGDRGPKERTGGRAEERDSGRETDHAGGLLPIPEEELFEGGWELEAVESLDLVLDTGDERPRIFSTILDLTGDEVEALRMGEGAWPV